MTRPSAALALAAAALVVGLGGCHRATVYATTPEAVRAALVGTTIPDMAFGKSAHTSGGEATADGVQWVVERGGEDFGAAGEPDHPVMLLTAKIAPSGSGTGVSVELAPTPGRDAAKFQAAMDQKPATANMFRAIAAEQVDSVLAGRQFDYTAVRAATAVAVLSALPDIRKDLDEQRAAYEANERDTVHRAYDQAAN